MPTQMGASRPMLPSPWLFEPLEGAMCQYQCCDNSLCDHRMTNFVSDELGHVTKCMGKMTFPLVLTLLFLTFRRPMKSQVHAIFGSSLIMMIL